jgi:hypothetical protein
MMLMNANFRVDSVAKVVLWMVLILVGASAAPGGTVNFGDANRGPSDSLYINGITISGESSFWTNGIGWTPQPGPVSTKSGSGLGGSAVGPIDSVDGQVHYAAGDSSPDWQSFETLDLNVDVTNMINSITIVPHFTVLGSSGPGILPFTFHLIPSGAGGFGDHQIRTTDLESQLSFQVSYYDGPDFPYFITSQISAWSAIDGPNIGTEIYEYRQQHLTEDLTFQFGFTIESMDYSVIPEPSATALFGVALVSFAVYKSRFRWYPIDVRR